MKLKLIFLVLFLMLLGTLLFSVTVTVEKAYEGGRFVGYYVSVYNNQSYSIIVDYIDISGYNIRHIGRNYFYDYNVVSSYSYWYTTTIYVVDTYYSSNCSATVHWNTY